MEDELRLETLNIWGGRLYPALLAYIRGQANKVDIFCFQEVYTTRSDNLWVRVASALASPLRPTNDLPERANIYQELQNALPQFDGYFSACQDHYAYHGPVSFDLSFGLAIFARKTLHLDEVGEYFVYRKRNSVVGRDNATIGRSLQYLQFRFNSKPFTVMNVHGLWNGKGKTDSPERLEQSRKIKVFLEMTRGAKILCGDLNLLPHTQSLALLEDGMDNLVKTYGIPSTRSQFYERTERFADYILVSPEVTIRSFEVLDANVSDHLPLLLTFL
jgi:exonuclease III